MAVQEQTPYIEHIANGVTTSFSLEFECKDKEHLIVLVDNVEPNVGTWSLVNGAVVFGIAPENGKIITIQRNTPFRRDTNFQSYDNSLRPATINKDFDWIWYKLQELGVADWILGSRIDALKNYVDDRDDELRAYLMEEIRKQGVALDQLDDYYNYLMQRLAQIAVDKGWDSSFVVDASGETQQQVNYNGGSKWHSRVGGYQENERVVLANGDIVKSTINENTNNPNVDMTGWKLDDNTVESVADMLSIQNPVDGMTINVKGYYEATNFALAQPYKGGGLRIYVESRKTENDDVLCINGWVLQVIGNLNLCQCGLKGDGLTDDRPALQKAVRVASHAKLNLVGNPNDIYLLNSLSSESGSVDLIWCNTNYFDLDLNGATIKIASGLGDYRTIFAAGWIHTKFKLYNGIIDQNTVNNPPQSPVLWSNTNGQRNIVSAYSVPHEYFEVSNIKMLDALGVWEINTTQAKRVYICNNEVHYSSVAVTHTDKTSFYVLPRQWAKVNENKFYGDTYGNATTAVELHGSNCEFKRNTVVGFRSPLFITPNAQEDNNPVLQNMYAIDNNFVSCQNGVLIWVESSANLNKPIENVHIRGNKVLIDSRLITNKDLGLTNGTGVGFLGSDEDCVIDGLYIQNNKINYNYNSENLTKDTPAGIDLTSFMPSAHFKWSNFYIQNNIVESAPCNGISVGNKAVGSHTSSIQNVTVSDNDVLNCGLGQVDNSFAVHIRNPSNLSKIKVHGNNFTETSDAGVTWMRFVAVDIGDGSEKTGVRFYDNDTSFSRDTSINDMYKINDVLVDDFRKNHLNHIDTNTKARIGSMFHDLNTGKIIVQSSLNANTPVWKEVTY